MKKLVTSVILAAGLVPALAFAQQTPNTITFKGEVTTQTCKVTINGEETSPVVQLPTVATTDFTAPGSVVGNTNFTIDLSGCSGSLANAKAKFVGNLVQASGNLGNTGTATGVSIQLANTGGTAINFSNNPESALVGLSSTGSASIPLTASYYAEDAVGAGTVVATTQYSISYE